MSKLGEYLEKNKIDARRLLNYSRTIESYRPEDRNILLAKRIVKGGKGTDEEKALAEKKTRSGKPVGGPTLRSALAGKPISGTSKQRILRAVNHVLGVKKKGEAVLSDLF